ncbi:UDP-N-acetylmuramoyl-tripeptide--D-alanyl-D-alanine ligase [Candidatus Berkelbacteria bacterium]|nr:UDP-N-acetylmuramoyl-tripeptide--D-alanyl-D-alanine ligase [Candidatus Berkelbacteria bacterium]
MAFLKSFVESLLTWAARRMLAVQQPLIVGVTGSSGKTSTKEAIGHVLRKTVSDRIVRVAPGNLNTEFGLPLAVLDLPKPEGKAAWATTTLKAFWVGATATRLPAGRQVLVLEYGAEQPGDIKRLTEIARPDIAVVTNVGEAHTQFLGSLDGVAREKGALVRALPKTGIAVLAADDERVKAMGQRTEARVVEVRAPVRELSVELAIAVAEHGFGIPPATARKALNDWERPPGRLQLLRGKAGSWLLDDTYNANPLSTTLALSELRRLAREKKATRSIAILGDMLELGEEENRVHTGVSLLAEKIADVVLLVGPRYRRTKRGMWFPGPVQAAEQAAQLAAKGDIILVKGSQSMRMEKVSEALLADPKEAAKHLVRQTPYWRSKPYVAP